MWANRLDGSDNSQDAEYSASDELAAGASTTISWTISQARDIVIATAAYQPVLGNNKMILMMSSIYDRIQENRKKLGVGDLGNFGLRDGLWKPKQGLATI